MELVPFSLRNPYTNSKKLKERFFDLHGCQVTVEQGWADDGRGGTDLGFGACVYEGSIVMANFLAENPSLVRGKRVIELGAGLGLASLVCAQLRCSEVVATDGDLKSMALLRKNVERNPGAVKCEQLLWGDTEKIKELGRFDVVIGCDIVALPYVEAFQDLAETLIGLSHTPRAARATTPVQENTATTTTTASSARKILPRQCTESMNQKNTDMQEASVDRSADTKHATELNAATIGRKHFDGSDMESSVVLLAYKARHCTEEPFFELAASRGFVQHILPREESIHADFLDDTSLSIMKLTL